MAHERDDVRVKAGNPSRDDIQPSSDPGDTPREVGVTTRDASGRDGDVPRVAPTPPPLPRLDDDAPNDGAPTDVVDFAPEEADAKRVEGGNQGL